MKFFPSMSQATAMSQPKPGCWTNASLSAHFIWCRMPTFVASKTDLPKDMPTSRQGAAYISFLEIVSSVVENSALPALCPLEQRILRIVARAGYDKSRLSVRDLMAMRELGVAATIHSRLKSMQTKGWISLADTEDARRKQVELTEPALRILDEVGARIEQATKNKR